MTKKNHNSFQDLGEIKRQLQRMEERSTQTDIRNSKPWLLLQEACEFLGVGETTLYTYRKEGRLQASKINRKLYFKRVDLEKLIESHKLV